MEGMDRSLPPESGGLSRSTIGRGAKLIQLPLGVAGRKAAGWGRKLAGADAATVDSDLADRAAAQMFQVLGELKGGAMKFGQALSMFEAMLPEEQAAPFREELRRLQDAAPPMPSSKVQAVLRAEFGPQWPKLFSEFDVRPTAAASIGQVHRGVWAASGTPVAIKVQYPGAEDALRTDLLAIRRLASVMSPLTGGVDIVALTRELSERIFEEVDYRLESASQQQAADGFRGHPDFLVPDVRAASRRAMVSDWIDGDKLITATDLPPAERNRIGINYVRFLFAGPHQCGLLHGDPHPGNYLLCPDGRLGVVDFGLVARLPGGLPRAMGEILTLARDGDWEAATAGLAREGFVAGDIEPASLLRYLSPFFEPAAVPTFHFTRSWAQEQFRRVSDLEGYDGIAFKLNVPPVYALIHRVWLGGIAVLAQLDVQAAFADVLAEFLPGWEPAPR